ncbi:hypothetical protein [Devosia sp. Naph2]|uniref:hypothetical protein n=1 Tax=Devosia polycyclovorans TaxID=3345148 RepID=UPI0035D04DD3
MPSPSRIIICAAGGGKTTRIVEEASRYEGRSLLVTYTRNNERGIITKFHEHGPVVPSNVEVATWFAFLLRELARPYRSAMHEHRIEGLFWQEGRSVPFVPEKNRAKHYFFEDCLIYSDKIAKFVCECDRLSGGAVMRRLAARFSRIYVDEIQDMAGYDLEVLELMLRSGVEVVLVGDHRQATFQTNYSNKNSAFAGVKIIDKFREWDKSGLAKLSYEQHTHRCHQDIADLGDRFFPMEPPTKSLSEDVTDHDGVFIVAPFDVKAYVARYAPQVLRYDKRTPCDGLPAMNFGESKGLTFDRVLIYPHGPAKKWISTGDIAHIAKSLPKMYVGATRARHSVAFVHAGPMVIPNAKRHLES